MSKFAQVQIKVASPIQTVSEVLTAPDAVTYEGGSGWKRDPKSELFLLAIHNMVAEDSFYEKAQERDERFRRLIVEVADSDPDWLARFVPYLRKTMDMRSASIVLAAETVHANLHWQDGGPGPRGFEKARRVSAISNRSIVSSALMRADEPAEFIGYWRSRYGRALPMPVKRGIADAVERMYGERNVIKYDGGDKALRFADVIEMTHPDVGGAGWRSHLFKHLLDERHGHATADGLAGLPMLAANKAAMALDQAAFREAFAAEFVATAGLTWEQASSKYGKLDAKFWEAMIPNMGIFALVRNLRNFDDSRIGHDARAAVVAKLTDADVIAKSRMFPLRFYAAYRETKTVNWASALEAAIDLSLANVPALTGRTLILVDISGSMDYPIGNRNTTPRLTVASIFGAALALRAEKADVVAFESGSWPVPFRKEGSVLRLTEAITNAHSHGGTNTWQAFMAHYANHDRTIILTDEQAFPGLPPTVTAPIYTFNVAGYKTAHLPSGERRYTFGGLTDAAFTAIELLERGADQKWPF